MKLNKLTQAVLAGSIAFSGAAIADGHAEKKDFSVSGNVTIATDYVFRGISQTDEGPAIQGGFDVEHSSGLYAGIWASNVDFDGTQGSTEFDYYGGFAGEISKDVGFDVGVLYFDYPGASDNGAQLNFLEYYGSVSAMGATLGVNYSPDFFGSVGAATYYYLDYGVDVGSGVGLNLHYGHQNLSADSTTTGITGDNGYDEWSVGFSKDWAGVSLGLTYHDTDLTGATCTAFTGQADGKTCDDRLVFTVSKSM